MDKIFNLKDEKNLRQSLRNNMPAPEIMLWQKLRYRQLGGIKFRRQHGIGKYIVDFYCPHKKLVIEIDGNDHFDKVKKASDKMRDLYLGSMNISVLRFTNKDVVGNIDGVLDKINKYIINHP